MPDYRSLKVTAGAPTIPQPRAQALEAQSRIVAHDSMRALDTLVGSGERVLLEFGLRGGNKFLIPSGTNPDSGSRVYPDKDTPRVVGRLDSVILTPGHFIGVEILALPSGPLQVEITDTPPDFDDDGAGGQVEIEVTYVNSDAQTVTCKAAVDLAASDQLYAAEPPNAYYAMINKKATAIPVPFIPSADHWQKWTRGFDVKASVVVRYIGSPRVIDGVIVEHKNTIVVDQADTRWPSAMYTHAGAPYIAHPGDYPVTQLNASDPGGSVAAIRRALHSHGRALGPFLFDWTSATEHIGDIEDWVSYFDGSGDDEAPAASMTGTTPTLLPWGLTSESANNPGWSTACYARQVDHGDRFFDGRTGVLPVWFTAYVKVSAGTGTYRMRTGISPAWSEIYFTTTNTSWHWKLEPGWLEVGTGPEDAPLARLWVNNSGANTCYVRDVAVFMQVRS